MQKLNIVKIQSKKKMNRSYTISKSFNINRQNKSFARKKARQDARKNKNIVKFLSF